jgi:hypothetical protein
LAVAAAQRRWYQGGSSAVAASSVVLLFCANVCALHFLPLRCLSLKPQRHKDFLHRREGQTTHYGLRKILHCSATKATLMLVTCRRHVAPTRQYRLISPTFPFLPTSFLANLAVPARFNVGECRHFHRYIRKITTFPWGGKTRCAFDCNT